MAGRPWYAFYPDAYERAAGTLSYVMDSAYRRMLDHYYKTGVPLSLDKAEIYRACRAMRGSERKAIDDVLAKFFIREGDGYHNERADEELAKGADISAKRSDAASKRHSKIHANDSANAHAIAEQLDTHSTATSTKDISHKKIMDGKGRPSKNGESAEFIEFYEAFPRKTSRGAATLAFTRALAKVDAETLIAGAKRYAQLRRNEDQKFTKHPATWLNQECWLDEDVSRATSTAAPLLENAAPNPLDRLLGETEEHHRVRLFHDHGIWPAPWGARPDVDPERCPVSRATLEEFGYLPKRDAA